MSVEIKNKWYGDKALKKLEDDIINKLQLAGELVSSNAKLNAPVDTGTLRDSIDFQIDAQDESVTIGTNVEYAPYQEFGTKFIQATHFLQNGLAQSINKIKTIFSRKVK